MRSRLGMSAYYKNKEGGGGTFHLAWGIGYTTTCLQQSS